MRLASTPGGQVLHSRLLARYSLLQASDGDFMKILLKSRISKKVLVAVSSFSLSLVTFLPSASANQTPTLPQLPGGIASPPASLPGIEAGGEAMPPGS